MSLLDRLFRNRQSGKAPAKPWSPLGLAEPQLPSVSLRPVKRETSERDSWLNPRVQASIRQRAQSDLDSEGERAALELVALYGRYNRVCNLRDDAEKAEWERLKAEAAEIGQRLCENGGAKRMLLVAFRAQRHGVGMRTVEHWWNDICGWYA